ncbi:MAG TPA: NAD(P)-dependent oxidoreductase [Gammaproteobacteria bacterium]
METTDYGFIGVGRMGGHMARRLLNAGFSLTAFDTSRAALDEIVKSGARPAATARDVANAAETVFLSLPTPDVVQKVALDLVGGGRVKHVVDLSTTGPQMARTVAAEIGKHGLVYIDSPVSGGMAGARDGKLAVMVSGPRGVYEKIKPALEQFGKLFFMGEGAGQGQVMKLANNLLSAAALVLSAEAVVMGVKAGLDPRQMLDVINTGSGRNSATQDKFPRSVLNGKFDFGFATGLFCKDLRLCVQEADALGVPMIAGSAVLQMYNATRARFGPESDFTEIVRLYEEWAGVEVRG